MSPLVNAALFYAGWFACVLGAAYGWPAIGPAFAAGVILLHLTTTRDRNREALLVLAVGSLGIFADSTQALLGVFSFPIGSFHSWLCPPWLAAIWMLFATTLNAAMGWLRGRYLIAAALGAVGGPLSYAYGARVGAIHFESEHTLLILALVWAVVMPTLLVVNRVVVSRRSLPAL